VAPAFFIEDGSEAFRRSGRALIVARVAAGARHAGATAAAGVLAFPWPFRVALTNPAAVFANEAFHGRCGFNLELEQY
jgi:hypothetical protein